MYSVAVLFNQVKLSKQFNIFNHQRACTLWCVTKRISSEPHVRHYLSCGVYCRHPELFAPLTVEKGRMTTSQQISRPLSYSILRKPLPCAPTVTAPRSTGVVTLLSFVTDGMALFE